MSLFRGKWKSTHIHLVAYMPQQQTLSQQGSRHTDVKVIECNRPVGEA